MTRVEAAEGPGVGGTILSSWLILLAGFVGGVVGVELIAATRPPPIYYPAPRPAYEWPSFDVVSEPREV